MRKVGMILTVMFLLFTLMACKSEPSATKSTDDWVGKPIAGTNVLTQQKERYLVYFYQPECPHCQEFDKVLTKYKKQEKALPVYRVNLSDTKEKETWEAYQIEGTPTLFEVNRDIEKQKIHVIRYNGVVPIEQLPKAM